MAQNFVRSIEALDSFLNEEIRIGFMLVKGATQYRQTGDAAQYEARKNNAVTVLSVIDRLKGRLPKSLRAEIELGRAELANRISELTIK